MPQDTSWLSFGRSNTGGRHRKTIAFHRNPRPREAVTCPFSVKLERILKAGSLGFAPVVTICEHRLRYIWVDLDLKFKLLFLR